MKYDNQLRYAVNIIKAYDGRYPLAIWLKDYFREHKQMGSGDRKIITHLVYGYFRSGHASLGSIEQKILCSLYFSPDLFPAWIDYFRPEQVRFLPADIFPWQGALSKGMDAEKFSLSFLQQPLLFIRIRPGKEKIVIAKLEQAGIPYTHCGNTCLSLPNSSKLTDLLDIDREALIQDMNSQRIAEFLQELWKDKRRPDLIHSVWDCCAASGGKSIMAWDLLSPISLTVSDIRLSIMNNLKDRLMRAGIKDYTSFTADLTNPEADLPGTLYDLIIADVPCSGSGTWARTPEQLYFFKEERITLYADKQKKIVEKIIPSLKEGGSLLYITCSVFEAENEGVVRFIEKNSRLRLQKMELLKGYEQKADSLFAALFINCDQSSLT